MANNFLDLYLQRIKYSQSPLVNLQTLRDLHLLHLQHIPYENIDVFCHKGQFLQEHLSVELNEAEKALLKFRFAALRPPEC